LGPAFRFVRQAYDRPGPAFLRRHPGPALPPGQLARERAGALGRHVDLHVADAQRLDFPDCSFDTVVCTFSLCSVPDDRRAVEEMRRVLRPGGLLLLADHVVSTAWPARLVQRLIEVFTIPFGGEHFRRRPMRRVRAAGFVVERHERFKLNIVERLAARKPAP
jgi:ubiquinone/menaquinone biosynthesis C-methylase UbiE